MPGAVPPDVAIFVSGIMTGLEIAGARHTDWRLLAGFVKHSGLGEFDPVELCAAATTWFGEHIKCADDGPAPL